MFVGMMQQNGATAQPKPKPESRIISIWRQKKLLIDKLKTENTRLRKLVWAAYPNFYRRLPKDIHKKILAYLDTRRLDVLCYKIGYQSFRIRRCLEDGTFTVSCAGSSRFRKMTSINLTLHDVCNMFNTQVEDVKSKIYWLGKRPQNNNLMFEEELQRLGLKRVTPRKVNVIRTGITTEQLLRKEAEYAALQHIFDSLRKSNTREPSRKKLKQ